MSKITGATIFEKDVLAGAKCQECTVLKLLFVFGCTPEQSTEILGAYGFCWRDKPAAEFLQEKIAENRKKMGYGKNYCLSYLLSDWPKWQAMKKRSAA